MCYSWYLCSDCSDEQSKDARLCIFKHLNKNSDLKAKVYFEVTLAFFFQYTTFKVYVLLHSVDLAHESATPSLCLSSTILITCDTFPQINRA